MAVAIEKPIFVIGSGRSGTTYLAKTLGMHPRIAHFPKETKFFPAFFLWLEGLDLEADREEEIARRFISRCLMAHTNSVGKLRLLEKTPSNSFVINWLSRCFPKSQFIHIYRDPRDVVTSLEKEILKPTIVLGAQRWQEHVETSLTKGELLGKTRFLNICYERLVLEPIDTFTEICSFLYEDPSPILDYVKQSTRLGAVGRWKKVLTTEQIQTIENICGNRMLNLGYEISSNYD